MKVKNTAGAFSINSNNEGFASRQKSLFDQLDVAEQNYKNSLKNGSEPMETNEEHNEEMHEDSSFSRDPKPRHFRGKESIFKKPHAPFSQKLQLSKIPDFKKNPHKWTKYTLNDVTADDMSEKTNTSAAMCFLKELEKRKQNQNEEENDAGISQKITFNRSKFYKDNSTNANEDEKKGSFVSSKLIMPEYVVGQTPTKSKKEKKTKPKQNPNEIKLSHLDNFEDEEG